MDKLKFNFIINCTDAELNDYINKDVDSDFSVFSRSDLEWCLQAYLILARRKKLDVTCSNRMLEGAVNIVHSTQLLPLKGNSSNFIVCVRADFPKRRWAHYHLIQNKNQLDIHTSLVPLWLQPGLIKRDKSRQGVKKVAYAGQIYNGNLAGSVEDWENLFRPHDIEFVSLPSGACNDLSTIDVLIGIRSFDTRSYNTKPPSKLINAWHADIPFIGGHDSAFKQVGTPSEDYLLVSTPEEVVSAVLKLRDDEALYNKLIKNGAEKAKYFTTDIIAKTWEDILTGPVTTRYKTWQSRKTFEKARFDILLSVGLLEHKSKQIAKKILARKFLK